MAGSTRVSALPTAKGERKGWKRFLIGHLRREGGRSLGEGGGGKRRGWKGGCECNFPNTYQYFIQGHVAYALKKNWGFWIEIKLADNFPCHSMQ